MPALSVTARHEYYVELGNSLPLPVLDKAEHRERRLTTAVEAFDALRPGDAWEARLAVQIVLAGAQAAECLREAGLHRDNFDKMTRCRAQAASLMREERAAKRMLAQEQKVRLAIEAVAGSVPAQPAVASAPLPQAEPQAPPPLARAASPEPQPAPVRPAVPLRPAAAAPAPQPAAAVSAPSPSPEAIAEAEAFAQENIVAAALIRRDRGVTPRNSAYFRDLALPADPAMIDALVRGTSLVLTVLDEMCGEMLDEAA